MFELIYNDETILIVENSFVLCLKSKLLPSFSPKKKVCWWLCNANAYATIYIATLFLVWWWYISTLLMWYFFIYLLYLMFQCKHGHSDDDFYWEQMANKKNSVFFCQTIGIWLCVCVCHKQTKLQRWPKQKNSMVTQFCDFNFEFDSFFSKNLTKQKKEYRIIRRNLMTGYREKKIENKPIIIQLYSIY